MSITPQYFEIREVGKTIKSTKKQYIWRFILDGKNYTIEMFTSVLSGKKKILQNGQIIYFDSKFKTAFQFPFHIGKNALNILQHGDKFELRINNQSFTHLWDNERTKRNFNYEDRDQIDPYKQKNYAQNYEQSTKPVSGRGNEFDLDRRQQRHKSQHQQKSNANSEDVGGIDPNELQAQIQAYEELSRKHKQQQHQQPKPSINITQQNKPQAKRSEDVSYNAYDFSTGFDHGFDKFSTNVQGGAGSLPPKKQQTQQQQQQDNDFDFNFDQPAKQQPQQQIQQQQAQPKPAPQIMGGADLFDLLGSTSTAPSQQPVQEDQSKNALDFFNDLDFTQPTIQSNAGLQTQIPQQQQNNNGGLDDMLGFGVGQQNLNTAIPQQQNQNSNNLFGGVPQQQQQQQQPEQQQPDNKPKFIPNLSSFYTQQQPVYPSQQELLLQQQMQQQLMMQQMMMMGGGNQGFQTNQMMGGGMNAGFSGAGMNTNVGLGGGASDWNTGFGGAQQQQPSQFMTSAQQNNNGFYQQPQQQQQQQQPLAGQQSYQQNTYQTSVPASNYGGGGAASTPFDLFN